MAWAASRTFSTSRSNGNSGVWTPMTTRPRSRYFSDHARTKASVRSQLMHVYVQKSTRTTFPARPSGVSGEEFSQPVAPSNTGRRPSAGKGPCVGGGARRRRAPPAPADLGVRVRVRGFLQKIVSGAALKSPVRISAKEFHRRSSRLRIVRHWHHPSVQVSQPKSDARGVSLRTACRGPDVAPFEARPVSH